MPQPAPKPTTARKAARKTPTTAERASAQPVRARAVAAPATARRIAVSGSQSGLGLAIRQRLEKAGVQVIGIDLPGKGAEIAADLSRPEGRELAVQGVLDACGGLLQGVVANAGVDSDDADLTFGVNYHGAVELLEGLRPALARAAAVTAPEAAATAGAAAVVTVSHAVSITPGIRTRAADALLAGHPGRARLWLAGGMPYAVSKLALARWIRREAPGADWAGAGIALNGVCPGAIDTPMLAKDLLDSIKGPIIRAMPKPTGRAARPDDLTGLYEFLLGPDARFIVGQLITADGGVEATWRRDDWPRAWGISMPTFLLKLVGGQQP